MVPLGVDTELFKPVVCHAEPGRVMAIASADTPLKGVGHLLHAVAKLRDQIATSSCSWSPRWSRTAPPRS